jgi:hypothetical protein
MTAAGVVMPAAAAIMANPASTGTKQLYDRRQKGASICENPSMSADAGRCHGDIANIDGQLRCIAGGPPPAQGYAPPPGQGYPSPPGAPGYPVGGGPPPGPGWDEHRAHCEELWRHENELRERIEYAPLGPDRDRLQYRSDEVHQELERQGCGR